jgi:hypothetical protein
MLRMFVCRWQLHFSLPITVHLQRTFEVHSEDGHTRQNLPRLTAIDWHYFQMEAEFLDEIQQKY